MYICAYCCTRAEYGYAWTQGHAWQLPTASGLGGPHWYDIDTFTYSYTNMCC